MNIQETFKITGDLVIKKYDASGVQNFETEVKNMVVTKGKQLIASRLYSDTTGPLQNGVITQMAIGEGVLAPNLSDVTLQTQVGIVDLYPGYPVLNVSDTSAKLTYVASFPAGVGTSATAGISEAGLFNASAAMLCRTSFPRVVKLAGETLEIFWTVTIN